MSASLGFKPEVTCAIEVSDFARAKRWYQEVLGFQQIYSIDDIGWCEMTTHIPGVSVGVSQVETTHPGPGVVLTWSVTDIEVTRRALEAQDVRFDGPTRVIEGLVKLASFYDPDGNVFMLAESLAG